MKSFCQDKHLGSITIMVKMPDSLQHGHDNEEAAIQCYNNNMINIEHPVLIYVSGLVVNAAFPHLGFSLIGKSLIPCAILILVLPR